MNAIIHPKGRLISNAHARGSLDRQVEILDDFGEKIAEWEGAEVGAEMKIRVRLCDNDVLAPGIYDRFESESGSELKPDDELWLRDVSVIGPDSSGEIIISGKVHDPSQE